ncbi:MAG: SBBP repeat-containing protein [Armatimonadetes bacterium]|nr:SBBP repeat-containing protein [Armatimonadota bacterium]
MTRCIFALLFAVSVASAQPDFYWAKRLVGQMALGDDVLVGVACDRWGNVFITGYSPQDQFYNDIWTIKYDAAGNQVWSRKFDGPASRDDRATAISVDPQGNCYVVGYASSQSQGFDYVTLKYSPSGDLLWARYYNGFSVGHDQAYAVVADPDGGCFVTGDAWGGLNNVDCVTLRYDPNGSEVWASRYHGLGDLDDHGTAICLDGAGNLIVAGNSFEGQEQGPNYLTIKYNRHTGGQLWSRTYNGVGSGADWAYAVCVDPDDNAIVTGRSWGGVGSAYDAATVKYAGLDGEALWSYSHGSDNNSSDQGNRIAADADGNVFVVGSTPAVFQGLNWLVIKLSSTGDHQWTRTHFGPSIFTDDAMGLHVNSDGSVIVGGYVYSNSDLREDFVAVQYGSVGSVDWTVSYDSGDQEDKTVGMVVSPQGYIYLVGTSRSSTTGRDYLLVRYKRGLPADANGDCNVDDVDLALVLEAFGLTGDRPEDIDRDGIVSDSDLALVLEQFGLGC